MGVLITGDAVLQCLERECLIMEQAASSHWRRFLDGFSNDRGNFTSTGLPEGAGLSVRAGWQRLAHYVFQIPQRIMGWRYPSFSRWMLVAKRVHAQRGSYPDRATLRHALTLSLLDRILPLDAMRHPLVVIGDGYGLFASLWLTAYRNAPYRKAVVVNLTQNLLIDAVYIRKSLPEVRWCLAKSHEEYGQALAMPDIDVILLQADHGDLIGTAPIGLAVNIASMQEMDLPVIQEYFSALRHAPNDDTYFYCCNRVEKTLFDGSAIRFADYPWSEADRVLVDELCPWLQYYYDKQFPFYHKNDGPVWHRLIQVHKAAQ